MVHKRMIIIVSSGKAQIFVQWKFCSVTNIYVDAETRQIPFKFSRIRCFNLEKKFLKNRIMLVIWKGGISFWCRSTPVLVPLTRQKINMHDNAEIDDLKGHQQQVSNTACQSSNTFTRQKAHAQKWTLKATLISSVTSLTAAGPQSMDICQSTFV